MVNLLKFNYEFNSFDEYRNYLLVKIQDCAEVMKNKPMTLNLAKNLRTVADAINPFNENLVLKLKPEDTPPVEYGQLLEQVGEFIQNVENLYNSVGVLNEIFYTVCNE